MEWAVPFELQSRDLLAIQLAELWEKLDQIAIESVGEDQLQSSLNV